MEMLQYSKALHQRISSLDKNARIMENSIKNNMKVLEMIMNQRLEIKKINQKLEHVPVKDKSQPIPCPDKLTEKMMKLIADLEQKKKKLELKEAALVERESKDSKSKHAALVSKMTRLVADLEKKKIDLEGKESLLAIQLENNAKENLKARIESEKLKAKEDELYQLRSRVEQSEEMENEIIRLRTEVQCSKEKEQEIICLRKQLEAFKERENEIKEDELFQLRSRVEQSKELENEIVRLRTEAQFSKEKEQEIVCLKSQLEMFKERENEIIELKCELEKSQKSAQLKETLPCFSIHTIRKETYTSPKHESTSNQIVSSIISDIINKVSEPQILDNSIPPTTFILRKHKSLEDIILTDELKRLNDYKYLNRSMDSRNVKFQDVSCTSIFPKEPKAVVSVKKLSIQSVNEPNVEETSKLHTKISLIKENANTQKLQRTNSRFKSYTLENISDDDDQIVITKSTKLKRRDTVKFSDLTKMSSPKEVEGLKKQTAQILLTRKGSLAEKRASRRMETLDVMNKMNGVLNQVVDIEKQLKKGEAKLNKSESRNEMLEYVLGTVEKQRFEALQYFGQLTIAMKHLNKKTENLSKSIDTIQDKGTRMQLTRDKDSLTETIKVIELDIAKQHKILQDMNQNIQSSFPDQSNTVVTAAAPAPPPIPGLPSFSQNVDIKKSSSKPDVKPSNNVFDLLSEIRNKQSSLKRVDIGETKKKSKNFGSGAIRTVADTLRIAIEKQRNAMLLDEMEDEDLNSEISEDSDWE